MFAWGLFIGLRQLADKGRYVFVFYTGGCAPVWLPAGPAGSVAARSLCHCLAAPCNPACFQACLLFYTANLPVCLLACLSACLFACLLACLSAVWNWWMLTAFFALASAASLRAWRRRRTGQQQLEEAPALAGWLDKAAVAAFMIETPVSE